MFRGERKNGSICSRTAKFVGIVSQRSTRREREKSVSGIFVVSESRSANLISREEKMIALIGD